MLCADHDVFHAVNYLLPAKSMKSSKDIQKPLKTIRTIKTSLFDFFKSLTGKREKRDWKFGAIGKATGPCELSGY